jgi:hypothetical protein
MKDIVAALDDLWSLETWGEDTEARGQAGQTARRVRKHRAVCRDAWGGNVIKRNALALAVALLATPAAAQQWADPEGHFVLNHGAAWRSVTPQTANPEVLAAFESVEPAGARFCNVRRQRFPAPTQMDQPAANRWMESFTLGPREASSRSTDEVEGVLVVSYSLSGGPFAGRYRAFALPAGAAVVRTEFLCAARSPLSPDDQTALDIFLSSFAFTPER